ncbi:MAG: hypothetical protein IT378_26595 [Sandaracinaceae bacterium]|nr:hypothetical protein [Sandaracinaceae bacterium]
MRRITIILAAIAASACTRNAILELELELPEAAGPVRFALVEVRSGESFDGAWSPESAQSFALTTCQRASPPPTCPDRTLDPSCSQVISVVTGGGAIEAPLAVRIRFCRDPRCAATEDAAATERRFVIERAFYLGRYTQARACIDVVPVTPALDPIRIDRCDVRCRDGVAGMYCRLDGTHFCEE